MSNLMSLVCKSGYSVVVQERDNYELTSKQMHVLQENWGKVDYKGCLSATTSRRIAHILEIWYRTIRVANDKKNLLSTTNDKKLVFLTLTLSSKQLHTDNEIKRNMLNLFLIQLNRSYKMVNYLWKAEKQKNGNIHFHIITDVYIDKNEVNHLWDSILFKWGYLNTQPTFTNDYTSPSTRIECVNDSTTVGSYMGKYMSKSDENGKVEGRVWGASKMVKELKDISFGLDSELEPVIVNYMKSEKASYNIGDFFTIFNIDFFFYIYMQCPYHRSRINIHYAGLYLGLYSESLEFNENELTRELTKIYDYE